jgi:LytS/YehU family sensor histidine kinase
LAIQLLIENAIKHNEISSESPLVIELKSNEKSLIISNKINRRISEEPSSKTGLKNIQKRYSYFTDLPISVNDSEGMFNVEIPLLKEV